MEVEGRDRDSPTILPAHHRNHAPLAARTSPPWRRSGDCGSHSHSSSHHSRSRSHPSSRVESRQNPSRRRKRRRSGLPITNKRAFTSRFLDLNENEREQIEGISV